MVQRPSRVISLHIVDPNPVKPVLFLQPGYGGPQRSGAIALSLMLRRDHKAPYFHLAGTLSKIKHHKADRLVVVVDGKGMGGIIKYPRLRQRDGVGRHKALLPTGQLHAQDFQIIVCIDFSKLDHADLHHPSGAPEALRAIGHTFVIRRAKPFQSFPSPFLRLEVQAESAIMTIASFTERGSVKQPWNNRLIWACSNRACCFAT